MRRLDFSNWTTRDITTFIGDELEGSSWSISKFPGVSFKDVMAEALKRWGNDLHIVTSADKKVLDAMSETRITLCSGKFMISNRKHEDKACVAELARRNSPKA